jgi:hypothetical protein
MECSEKIKEALTLMAEGSLADTEKAEIEAHLKTCPACRAELGELRKLFAILGNAGLPEPSIQFLAELPEKVWSGLNLNKNIVTLRSKKAPRWIAAAAAAAIAVFVIAAGTVIHLRQVQPQAPTTASEQIAPEDVLIATFSNFTVLPDSNPDTSLSETNLETPYSAGDIENLIWIENRMAEVLPPEEKDIFETMASFTDEEVGNILVNIDDQGGDT